MDFIQFYVYLVGVLLCKDEEAKIDPGSHHLAIGHKLLHRAARQAGRHRRRNNNALLL